MISVNVDKLKLLEIRKTKLRSGSCEDWIWRFDYHKLLDGHVDGYIYNFTHRASKLNYKLTLWYLPSDITHTADYIFNNIKKGNTSNGEWSHL